METRPLVCPNCKSTLEMDSMLRCKSCNRSYSIVGGIPDFLGAADFYWGEIAPDKMEEVIQTARTSGVATALTQMALERPEFAYYLLSYARLDWLFHCLSSANTGTCLDIGSGWGSLTFPLAKYYREVWSLEAVWPRIEFQKIVKEQQDIANVNFARANMLNLPFPDNYFDLVVASGALEWAGIADQSKNARDVQLDFLKEVKRTLKPTGCLYIGIENRFGLQFLRGARDHSGLPFTSVLPRRVADLAVRFLRKTGGVYKAGKRTTEEWKDYRTYTYTAPGYEKLLRQAGYRYSVIYWAPDYNHPLCAGRVKDPQSFIFYLNHLQRSKGGDKKRLMERLLSLIPLLPRFLVKPLVSFFSPCFLIYAYPSEKPETLESKISKHEDCQSFLRRSGADTRTAKVHYFLLRDGNLHTVVKFPRFKEGLQPLEREERLMEQHNDIAAKRYDIDEITVFTEPDLKAVRCKFSNPSHNDRAINWLIDFQSKTMKGFWNPTEVEREVGNLQRYISETSLNLNAETRQRVSQDLDLFLKNVSQMQLEKVSEHGDYCTLNILIDGQKMYVIDWEFYKEEGNPLFDFCFFVMTSIREASLQKSAYRDEIYRNLVGRGSYSPTLTRLLNRFSEEKSFSPETMFYATPYMLTRCIHRHDPRFGSWGTNFAVAMDLLDIWSKVTFHDSVFGSLSQRKKLTGDKA
jgi:ubiquinone/menaquinone biosynthesis C-methylase UbiE